MKEIKDTLDRIFDKMDKIDSKQDSMAILQAEHTAHLAEHMRRTELIEERLDKELPPVKKHVDQVRGALKLAMALIPVAGAVAAWLALR